MRSCTIVLLFVSIAAAARAQEHAGPCAAADRLFESSSYAAAERAYMRERAVGDPTGCAGDGLRRVSAAATQAAALVELGRSKLAQKDRGAATAAFQRALEIHPGFPAAELAIDEMGRRTDRANRSSLAAAEALVRHGFLPEAQQELRKILEENPETQVPEALHLLSGGMLAAAKWRLRSMSDIVTVVLMAGIAVFAIFRRFARARIRIEDFETYSNGPSGRAVAAMAEDRLRNLLEGPRAPQLRMVHGPIVRISIPANITSTVAPHLSWVSAAAAVVDFVFHRREIIVSGVILPAGKRGAGLTLTVSESRRHRGCVTLWSHTFTPAGAGGEEDPYALVTPAAVWLLYELTKRLGESPAELIGTTEWRSLAYLRTGLQYEASSKDFAEEMFVKAIQADPNYRAARVNFASILLDEGENERAIEQLEKVRDEVGAERDAAWYSARYRLALAHYNSGDTQAALQEASSLLLEIRTVLEEISAGAEPEADGQLMKYLRGVEGVAVTVVAGLQAELGVGDPEVLLQDIDETMPSGELQYNLACTRSMMAAREKRRGRSRWLGTRSLDHLKLAWRLAPQFRTWAMEDPSLEWVRKHRSDEFAVIVELRAVA